MAIKIGQKYRVKRFGSLCHKNCGYPCIGEIVVLKDINHYNEGLVLEFKSNGTCSKFLIQDLELCEKLIKQYGIVNFINSTTKKEEQNV